MTEQLQTYEYQPQQELLEGLLAPSPTVIGVEGGPCSGKTTALERLTEQANTVDRPVVVLPEAATRHIEKLSAQGISVGWLAEHDREGYLAFEADVLRTIVDDIAAAKQEYAGTNAIIVADRVDIGAYVSEAEYTTILQMTGLDMVPMLGMVDQLYYLPTVARENRERYSYLQATNPARYETADQAIATCLANQQAVARHPELHVVMGGDFKENVDQLVDDILHPEREVELSLSWRRSDDIQEDIRLAHNNGLFLGQHVITQSYHTLSGQEFRLRKLITEKDEVLHYVAIKSGTGIERTEDAKRISASDYQLLRAAPQVAKTLDKIRYDFLRRDLVSKRTYKWSADFYTAPHLQRWEVEVAIHNEQDARKIWPYNAHTKTSSWYPAELNARQIAEL